jgi:succinate dehydrogenase / fumarate reductase cytochrome b subunit
LTIGTESMSDRSPQEIRANRPVSPHLQIYKPLLTMVMSIVHRITGAALYLGTLLVVWWLLALAMGPDSFAVVQGAMSHWLGKLVMIGYTWALFHHMLGGIRHFIWDTGHGYSRKARQGLSLATLIGSLTLTALTWTIGALI